MTSTFKFSDADHFANIPSHRIILPLLREKLLRFDGRVLEIGSGTGEMASVLANDGVDITCLEPSDDGYKIIRSRYPDLTVHKLSVYDDILAELGQFDFIFSIEVIEHLFEPQALLANVNRALTANGEFLITTPYHGYLKNLALAVTGKMDAHFTVDWECGHIKFFSKKTLLKMLRSEGLLVENFKGLGRVPFLWRSMMVTGRKA